MAGEWAPGPTGQSQRQVRVETHRATWWIPAPHSIPGIPLTCWAWDGGRRALRPVARGCVPTVPVMEGPSYAGHARSSGPVTMMPVPEWGYTADSRGASGDESGNRDQGPWPRAHHTRYPTSAVVAFGNRRRRVPDACGRASMAGELGPWRSRIAVAIYLSVASEGNGALQTDPSCGP